MQIKLTNVMVDDQAKALRFYTEILGFEKSKDISCGKDRWLTVVSPEGSPDIELLLEPMGIPAAKIFQKALLTQGIPAATFTVDDIQAEYEKLVQRGVRFRTKPTEMGPTMIAVFEDTCGNLIQINEER